MIRLLLALMLLLTFLMAASLAFGDVSLGWQELYDVLMGTGRAQLQSEMIVWDLRLPRLLLALLVGVALALAGTISIAIMRNPLADPGVLGINSGAAAAAMAVIVLIRDPPVALLQVAGFLGASAMALAVFCARLAQRHVFAAYHPDRHRAFRPRLRRDHFPVRLR
ncbi:iron chelate uptake ABC transporter family permease subunit [Agrobacterium vitis]|uniref:iron chelate uptake ABC transporter family permease subunit n=1 Tax=Agrobacterium vitis TaxID=373 RepID=UPI0022A6D705|nr:iron chelate uptake ABC transporter family permease subunit [Agrobacterium vitis]